MIFKVNTITNMWLEWHEIIVEVDSNKSLPNIEIIWLPDTAIKESKERIRWTFRNIGINLPSRKIILNLSPSNIRKIWTRFDLAMAFSILLMINEWNFVNKKILDKSVFIWELWLDWSLKNINWILPSVISAIWKWYKNFFIPYDNLYELKYINWINIYPLKNFQELVDFFIKWNNITKEVWWEYKELDNGELFFENDFEDIKWHIIAKRALSIAAWWLHNILMIWAPGSWKTMLAKSINSILPPLNFEEILEVSKIYSIVGKLNKEAPLITKRPFRPVHHTASKVSIVGWWSLLSPWEISMAHKWILFFDELAEFPREVLEVLRQPLEDKKIVISRAHGSVDYPAHFMFTWTMNPCKCGYYKDLKKNCKCSINEIKKYQSKISWPLLDRFDMILEIPRENIEKILDKQKWESSKELREKVYKCWEIQQKRFEWTNISTNSQMWAKEIEKYIKIEPDAEIFLKNSIKALELSPRVIHRTIKLARTIADLENIKNININQIAEAIQYRSKNMLIEQ